MNPRKPRACLDSLRCSRHFEPCLAFGKANSPESGRRQGGTLAAQGICGAFDPATSGSCRSGCWNTVESHPKIEGEPARNAQIFLDKRVGCVADSVQMIDMHEISQYTANVFCNVRVILEMARLAATLVLPWR